VGVIYCLFCLISLIQWLFSFSNSAMAELGDKVIHQSCERTKRKPLLLFLLSGLFLLRLATRQLLSLLFQLPPRRTRLVFCLSSLAKHQISKNIFSQTIRVTIVQMRYPTLNRLTNLIHPLQPIFIIIL